MQPETGSLASDVEALRRDGSVVVRCQSKEQAGEWRAAIRKVCRTAQLRVRTGVANADARIVWAFHIDQAVTVAAERAANRAIELALSGDGNQPVPFHELVREEQRKLLMLVPPAGEAAPDRSRR
jgi:hypothetical protein